MQIIKTVDERKYIQLESFVSRLFAEKNGIEPLVAYNQYDDFTAYKNESEYDYASLAISPRYSPKEADRLIDVILRYIDID